MMQQKAFFQERGGKYVDVKLYPDRAAMRRAISRSAWRERGIRDKFGDTEAYFDGVVVDGGDLMGTMYFHPGSYEPGMIAHECTHAALHWYHVVFGRNLSTAPAGGTCTKSEELFCDVLGRLVHWICSWNWEGVIPVAKERKEKKGKKGKKAKKGGCK